MDDTYRCRTCRHWRGPPQYRPVWGENADGDGEPFYSLFGSCAHPDPLLVASGHPAYPDCEGEPAMHPDFGCRFWAAVEREEKPAERVPGG